MAEKREKKEVMSEEAVAEAATILFKFAQQIKSESAVEAANVIRADDIQALGNHACTDCYRISAMCVYIYMHMYIHTYIRIHIYI